MPSDNIAILLWHTVRERYVSFETRWYVVSLNARSGVQRWCDAFANGALRYETDMLIVDTNQGPS